MRGNPNIGPLHDIGEQDGELFIVMALYEGETLNKRLEKGPLPVEEALGIFRELALGVEALRYQIFVDFGAAPYRFDVADRAVRSNADSIGALENAVWMLPGEVIREPEWRLVKRGLG